MHGVRIDHPDGLYDPQQYFQRLQHYVLCMAHRLRETDAAFQEFCDEEITALLDTALAQASNTAEAALYRPLYMVVEKILAHTKCSETTGQSTVRAAMTSSTCLMVSLLMQSSAAPGHVSTVIGPKTCVPLPR